MRDVVKKILLCVAMAVSIQMLSGGKLIFAQTNSVQATSGNSVGQATSSSNTTSVNQIAEKSGVYPGKIWTIRLSKPVDPSSVTNDIIKVVEKDTGNSFKVDLHIQDSDSSCINIIPIDNYTNGKEYSVIISKNLKSKDGSNLKNDVQMDFKIQDLPTSADDINQSIMEFDSYTLPDQVQAKLPDGSTKQWNVQWDNKSIDTAVVGTYTITGKLEGLDVTVKYNLTVTPYQVSKIGNPGRPQQSAIQVSLVNYLMASKANRDSVYQRAIQLHYGDASNTCVYFASEALRRVGLNLPADTCNTGDLTNKLSNLGWKSGWDKNDLIAGDLCFTRDISGTDYPTHVYTFIRWVNPSDHSLAYIVDNQPYRTDDNDELHTRDIEIVDVADYDAFRYYMYKPN